MQELAGGFHKWAGSDPPIAKQAHPKRAWLLAIQHSKNQLSRHDALQVILADISSSKLIFMLHLCLLEIALTSKGSTIVHHATRRHSQCSPCLLPSVEREGMRAQRNASRPNPARCTMRGKCMGQRVDCSHFSFLHLYSYSRVPKHGSLRPHDHGDGLKFLPFESCQPGT